jgi:hypothetical protein
VRAPNVGHDHMPHRWSLRPSPISRRPEGRHPIRYVGPPIPLIPAFSGHAPQGPQEGRRKLKRAIHRVTNR